MSKKIFIDSDVILDIALERQPFFTDSLAVLTLVEENDLQGYTSSNCIANIHYLLRKKDGDKSARDFIKVIIEYVKIIGIEHEHVLPALDSDFKDFEDSLQFYSALRNGCQAIITRNGKDYQQTTIDVYSPSEFLQLKKGETK